MSLPLQVSPETPATHDFFALAAGEFDELVARWGWPRFRADQVRDWVYRKLVTDPAAMSNLSKADRALLAEHIRFGDSEIVTRQDSSDGTVKLLLRYAGGASAETVMIPDGDRRTACVSSQVGCPVGCKFCASGIGGVKSNLSAGQIVEQIVRINQILTKARDPERITNVVFMGMGEPLANYANVMKAIRIMHDPACLNIGGRRITVSTVGVPAKMRELARELLPLNLAISLHAPNEQLRRELIPWAEHFSIDQILDAARYYFEQTGREITLEYILLAGVNDRPEHARQLSAICRTLRANVNLIRYNEVATLPFGRPKSDDVLAFQSILRHNGVNAHVRKSRGRDIDAACGQLRRKELARAGGFTLVEFTVVLGIVVILLSIFIPYLLKASEMSKRTRCMNNLKRISDALAVYVKDNGSNYPRVRYDEKNNPNGYVAFTGPDDSNPFAEDSTVQANDVTASLWLLVREGLVGPEAFVCPSTDDTPDRLTDPNGRTVPAERRGNFREPGNLSYSYCSPFSTGYRLIADMPGDFAVLADKNPGVNPPKDDVTGPPWNADPVELSKANSRNHGKAGQMVLSSQMKVRFERTPYCGVGNVRDKDTGVIVVGGDNIYTALTRLPVTERPPGNANGVIGHGVGPTWQGDSYLVPTATDVASPPLPASRPTTATTSTGPTTTTLPATTQSQ